MMLYLTGASVSLSKSSDAPQTDVQKSLGGYISSSVVPNGAINSLFDMISLNTLKNRTKEIIAVGLINKLDIKVTNVEVKMVTKPNFVGKFKVAAVSVDDDYLMEHIDNRYAEPIQAEFHDIDFYRASVIAEILNPAVAGEVIDFDPFRVTAIVTESGMKGTMYAILKAFSEDANYLANKLSENEFEIICRNYDTIDTPIQCEAFGTDSCKIEFKDLYRNQKDNTALVADVLNPNEAIGIWIQRSIEPQNISNEELIRMYNEGVKSEQVEEVEFLVSYETKE